MYGEMFAASIPISSPLRWRRRNDIRAWLHEGGHAPAFDRSGAMARARALGILGSRVTGATGTTVFCVQTFARSSVGKRRAKRPRRSRLRRFAHTLSCRHLRVRSRTSKRRDTCDGPGQSMEARLCGWLGLPAGVHRERPYHWNLDAVLCDVLPRAVRNPNQRR
jgi:hypothetical protein